MKMINKEIITQSYDLAKKQYSEIGVNTDNVIEDMQKFQISLHCWQADDVGGFETPDSELTGGGIQVTGNYPGKARNINELKQDLEKAMSLLPGKQRLNLHAIYGDFGGKFIDRDKIEPKHFQSWIDWAKKHEMGLDFNPTCFSHPNVDSGFTLSSKDENIRQFWVEHVKRCRAIAAEMGKQLETASVHNIWIPDGSKDIPADRFSHRKLLKKSLDEIFAVKYPTEYLKDAVESKLFGIGVESMTVGSHDFYLSYAVKNDILICIDNGHFHPTEQAGDKISSVLLFVPEILLHVTRPVRWDSDHVVNLNDEILLIAHEIVRSDAINKVNIGLDFFDASLNRIGAYVTGTRAMQQALMIALLEPLTQLKEYETKGKYFERMALLEILKAKPFGAVWDYYCLTENVAISQDYIAEVQQYETNELSKR